MQQNPDVIKKLLAANVNETLWINDHTDAAIKAFNTEFQKLTGGGAHSFSSNSMSNVIEFTLYRVANESAFRLAKHGISHVCHSPKYLEGFQRVLAMIMI